MVYKHLPNVMLLAFSMYTNTQIDRKDGQVRSEREREERGKAKRNLVLKSSTYASDRGCQGDKLTGTFVLCRVIGVMLGIGCVSVTSM